MIRMKSVSLVRCLSFVATLFAVHPGFAQGQSPATQPAGRVAPTSLMRFRATLESPGGELPFGLEVGRQPDGSAIAWIVNGAERIRLPDVRFSEDRLRIDIRHYDAILEAHAAESAGQRDAVRRRFVGTWKKRSAENTWSELPFEAVEDVGFRFRPGPRVEGELAKSQPIEGRWRVTFGKSEGPAIGEFRKASDGGIEGTFLTMTGDYRFLAGDYEAGRLRLSAFDGAHAFLFDARLDEADRLRGDFWSRDTWHEEWTAIRDPEASLPDGFGLAQSPNDIDLASVKFLGLDGKRHSLDDDGYRGKPRVIEVFGTWCPNCHDAADVLNDLHQTYAAQGLAVIGVAFEATGKFERDAKQVRRFIDRHDVKYPVWLGGKRPQGATDAVFPLLDRIRAYPTTLFVSRDGKIVAVHTGFSGPATGEAYLRLRATFERHVQELLEAQASSSSCAREPVRSERG